MLDKENSQKGESTKLFVSIVCPVSKAQGILWLREKRLLLKASKFRQWRFKVLMNVLILYDAYKSSLEVKIR